MLQPSPRTSPHPQNPASPGDTQASFTAWLARLRRTLKQQLGERAGVPQQRRLLLHLEKTWKMETQLIFPALDAAEALQPSLRHALREVELLRDMALLVERSEPTQRDIAWSVIEGLAELHFARVDALLQRPSASGADWRALLDEATAWLAQGDDEMRAQGDIEDEDRDPVGLPPR